MTIPLLVCAATPLELQTYLRDDEPLAMVLEKPGFLVTGVGIPLTLSRTFAFFQHSQPALILNIGIAGAYPKSSFEIGDIVIGTAECYGDVGFELPREPRFRSIIEGDMEREFYAAGFPLHPDPRFALPEAKLGRGCTVNSCTGTLQTGLLRERLFSAQFETMEGAAVAQAGQEHRIPVCEVRAISNRAADRDMRPENIRLALERLRAYLLLCRQKEGF